MLWLCDTGRQFNIILLPINYAPHVSVVKSDLKAVYGMIKKNSKSNELGWKSLIFIISKLLIKFDL